MKDLIKTLTENDPRTFAIIGAAMEVHLSGMWISRTCLPGGIDDGVHQTGNPIQQRS